MSTNSFLTVKEIARQALPRLIENLVFPNLVHRDFSETFQMRGDTIQVRKPVVYEAVDFDGELDTQNMGEDSVEVKLDKLADVSVAWSAIQGATNIDDLNRLFIIPASQALAQKINADGLSLYKDVYKIAGTAGTTPDAVDDINNIMLALDVAKAPLTDRYGVWDPYANAKLSLNANIMNAEKSGSVSALRQGSIGVIQNIENYMSQAVKTHTKGTLAVSGGKILAKAEGAVGAKTITLTKESTNTLTGTVVIGDVLSVGGKTYTVTKGASAGSNEIAVEFLPALVETVATTAEWTITGSHVANIGFHKSAFAFVTRPLETPPSVECYVTNFNGITLRVTKGYSMITKTTTLSMDVLYGYKTMYPELAVRAMG
jgi:hypothetical protein